MTPYRSPDALVPAEPHTHTENVNGGVLLRKRGCDLPGWFARFWSGVQHGDRWTCGVCRGQWEWWHPYPSAEGEWQRCTREEP